MPKLETKDKRKSGLFPESAQRAALINVVAELRAALKHLCHLVRRDAEQWEQWWAWSPLETNLTKAAQLDRIIEGIKSIHYEEGQAPVDVVIYPSVITVSMEACDLAVEINRLKNELHQCAIAMSERCKREWNEKTDSYDQLTLFRYALRHAGLGDLNFWQASRKLTVLTRAPRRISYVWYRPFEMVKMSVGQAKKMIGDITITARNAHQIHEDLKQLKVLPNKFMLAKRVARPPHPRVNLVFGGGGDTSDRALIQGSMPILMSESLPEDIRPLPAEAPDEPRYRPVSALDTDIHIRSLGLNGYRVPTKKKRSNELKAKR